MKNTKNRIILVAEIVFIVALLWGSAQIIKAQNWQAPSQAFPSANVVAPLDVSSNPQTKTGTLTLKKDFSYSSSLGIGYKNAIGGILYGSTSIISVFYPFTNIAGINNQTQIQNGYGALYVNTKGLVLPNVEASLLNTATGTITYDPSSGTVKLYNGKWVDIGTGTGTGGTEYWKANGSTGIYYQGGNVTIANNLFTQSGFYYLKTVSLGNIKNSFAFINRASAEIAPPGIGKMNCDTTDTGLECTNNFYSQQGEQGQIRYDKYHEITCPSGYILNGNICDFFEGFESISATVTTYYKEFIYDTRQVNSGTNSATLSVGSIDIEGDINIGNPKWSKSDVQIETRGGNVLGMNTKYRESWIYCPEGYFMIGFRLGRESDNTLSPLIQCAKL